MRLLVLGIILVLAGCKINSSTDNLRSLQHLSANNKTSSMGALRAGALRDTALSVGARGGLAFRSKQINSILLEQEPVLYRVFNFNAMVLDKNVLPPVLVEGRGSLSLAGSDVIRAADRNYNILQQARFVTVAPTWRDYLWMSYIAPEAPDRSLLPKNREERAIWRRYTEEGFKAGIQQAEAIFQENIGRLKRDMEGMIRYRLLLAKNIVSPPFVAQMDLGITGGGDELNINDRLLRITAFPQLKADSSEWKTEITLYDEPDAISTP